MASLLSPISAVSGFLPSPVLKFCEKGLYQLLLRVMKSAEDLRGRTEEDGCTLRTS